MFQKEMMKSSNKSFKKIPQNKMSPEWKAHQVSVNNWFLKNRTKYITVKFRKKVEKIGKILKTSWGLRVIALAFSAAVSEARRQWSKAFKFLS